jgi:hypothetical protein
MDLKVEAETSWLGLFSIYPNVFYVENVIFFLNKNRKLLKRIPLIFVSVTHQFIFPLK